MAPEVFKLFRGHADSHLYSTPDALINGEKTLQVTQTGVTGENRAAHHRLHYPPAPHPHSADVPLVYLSLSVRLFSSFLVPVFLSWSLCLCPVSFCALPDIRPSVRESWSGVKAANFIMLISEKGPGIYSVGPMEPFNFIIVSPRNV